MEEAKARKVFDLHERVEALERTGILNTDVTTRLLALETRLDNLARKEGSFFDLDKMELRLQALIDRMEALETRLDNLEGDRPKKYGKSPIKSAFESLQEQIEDDMFQTGTGFARIDPKEVFKTGMDDACLHLKRHILRTALDKERTDGRMMIQEICQTCHKVLAKRVSNGPDIWDYPGE